MTIILRRFAPRDDSSALDQGLARALTQAAANSSSPPLRAFNRGESMTGGSSEAAARGRLVRWSSRASVVALLVAAPGCVKHAVIPDEPDTITIRVSNNNALDMTVYAVNQSMRIRLGMVTTASTQR